MANYVKEIQFMTLCMEFEHVMLTKDVDLVVDVLDRLIKSQIKGERLKNNLKKFKKELEAKKEDFENDDLIKKVIDGMKKERDASCKRFYIRVQKSFKTAV
jgi:hypothetical protein